MTGPWLLAAVWALCTPPEAAAAGGADASDQAQAYRLLRSQPSPGGALRAAGALRRAGLHSAARARLVAVLSAEDLVACSPRCRRAATLLAEPSELPWYGPVERLIARLAGASLNELPLVTRGRLLRRAGQHRLRQGRLDEAARLFRGAHRSAEARYLLALIVLRRGGLERALTLLRQSMALARPGSDLADLALLARARLTPQAPRALALYRRVALGSPWFFRARQELAWTALAAGRPREALAQSALFEAPRLAGYYRPDGAVVEAASLLALCRPKLAARRARQAEAALDLAIAGLVSFLRHRPEWRLYYLDAAASIAGRRRGLTHELASTLLADASFRRAALVVGALQRERALLFHGHAGLRRMLGGALDGRLVAAQQQAGRTVRRLLVGTLGELRRLRLRAQELRFDAGLPRRRVPLPADRASPGQEARWPLIGGELWPDELGTLTVALPSACVGRGATVSSPRSR